MSDLFLTAAPTPLMASVNLSWLGVVDTVEHILNLLESQGQAAVGIARNLLKLVAAVSSRDMIAVFAIANETYVDVAALIAAIKAEFGK